MQMKLVGYAHSEGKFKNDAGEQIEFNTLTLDIIADKPVDGKNVKSQHGFHCSTMKLKMDQFHNLFPPEIKNLSDLDSWCGKEIQLEYCLLGSKPQLCGISLKK